MSKNRKNVNEEVIEEVKDEEIIETTEETIVEEPKKKKINWKAIGKIAIGSVIVLAGALVTIIAVGGSATEDSADIYTDENGNLVIPENENDSENESEETEK